jgi:ATPase subunit of ABC transporter with duplicated ATPase domains
MPAVLHDFRLAADRLGYALADGRTLFTDITLGFGRERTGLVGPNGAGKSTLVRLLAGELSTPHGSLQRRGTVAHLPQNFELATDGTLADVLGIGARLAALDRVAAGAPEPGDLEQIGDGWDLRERAMAALARFGVGHLPLDRPVTGVSGGEGTRVALAGLTLRRPDFLLLDEPTNNLDPPSRTAIAQALQDWPGAMVIVSHDTEFVEALEPERVLMMPDGDVDFWSEDLLDLVALA